MAGKLRCRQEHKTSQYRSRGIGTAVLTIVGVEDSATGVKAAVAAELRSSALRPTT